MKLLRTTCLTLCVTLLGACGGGGGSADDPVPVVRPFVVLTNVNGVPMLLPGLSYELRMDSGDRLELNASPAGMQWIVVADGNVVEAEASEDGAHWAATLRSPRGGQIVIRARSSADPSQEATLTVLVNPQRYASRAATAGEVQVWRETNTRNDGASAVSRIQASTTQVETDGRHTVQLHDITAGLPGSPVESRRLDAGGNRLALDLAGGQQCSYSAARRLLDFPLYYGKSWRAQWDYQCSDGAREKADALVTVDGYERITVPQGAHDALRVTAQLAITESNDPALLLGAAGQAAYAQDVVCWWSVTLQRTVKCSTATRYVGNAPAGHSKTLEQELLETR